MPRSFPTDLKAHLEFASGKIDQGALAQRLAARDVVSDSPAQAAARHLLVAQRFIDQGQLEQAQAQITQGLSLAPSDPMLLLAAARVAVLTNKPQAAIDLLDKLPAETVPGSQKILVRARALMATDRWSDAKSILPDAIKLNPNPSEGHYLLGLCYQHDREFDRAAEQFRLAYEKSPGSAPAR
jgi:predicted Zn-dependent protease